MLHHGVIAGCREEFKSLSADEFNAFDRRSTDTEFAWLWSVRASHFVHCLEPASSVGVKPREEVRTLQRPGSERYRRLVNRRLVGTPQVEAGRPRRMTLCGR